MCLTPALGKLQLGEGAQGIVLPTWLSVNGIDSASDQRTQGEGSHATTGPGGLAREGTGIRHCDLACCFLSLTGRAENLPPTGSPSHRAKRRTDCCFTMGTPTAWEGPTNMVALRC